MSASIQLAFDELPPDGRVCWACKELITGKAFYPYLQVMDPKDVVYFWPWCEKCVTEGEETE